MRAAPLLLLAACGVNETPQPGTGPTLPSCVPDRDGQITAAELPVVLGATIAYYASPTGMTRAINTSGATIWDLSEERADDTVIALGPSPVKAQWYATSFPAGQFVVDAGAGLDGIYHQDDQALWLDGTASHEAAPAAGKTLIRYPLPIAVLRFPVADGDAYTTTAQIPDGVVAGLPFIGTDQVDVDVTGGGRLDVPYVQFSPALRVRTSVTRKPSTGTPVVTRRTTLFLFECFGEVARAESRVDEPAPDFTTAAYLRRFALGVTP
jgi:hypothetical protein